MAISKSDLANRLELDESMISRLCTGQRRASVTTMFRMMRVFGVSGDVLIRAQMKGTHEFSALLNRLIQDYNENPQQIEKENTNDGASGPIRNL